jgi:4-hydroxybenzoate polyprenyltransferase/phosphoserine phosphatase
MERLVNSDTEHLIVDLDGTLISSDLLIESAVKTLMDKWYLAPFVVLKALFVLVTSGLSGLKIFFAEQVKINPSTLPYRLEVIDFIKDIKSQGGKKVFLISAAAQPFVTQINQHLKLFDGVYGTTLGNNLKSSRKRDFIVKELKISEYDYIGDSVADIPVWLSAKNRFVICSESKFANLTSKVESLNHILSVDEPKWRLVFKSLRIHQWAKNILIFVPLLTAHKWNDLIYLYDALLGFFSFSICASAVYIINDLADLESDRLHRTKKHRPFASGQLPIIVGAIIAPVLVVLGLSSAYAISKDFFLIVLFYLFLTTLYSFLLKRIALIDIIILSTLYTLRLFAGAAIVLAPISQWLAAFSMFIFFSLAALKRFIEVSDARRTDKKEIKGRGYTANDLEMISHFGVSSGLVAVLVLALYVNSDEIVQLYKHPQRLWILCPLFFYWITRLWLKASRNKVHDDPIIFAIKDKGSLVTGLLVVLSVILSL